MRAQHGESGNATVECQQDCPVGCDDGERGGIRDPVVTQESPEELLHGGNGRQGLQLAMLVVVDRSGGHRHSLGWWLSVPDHGGIRI